MLLFTADPFYSCKELLWYSCAELMICKKVTDNTIQTVKNTVQKYYLKIILIFPALTQ